LNDSAFDDFNPAMDKILQDFKLPGFAAAAVRGDEVVLSKGYGVRDTEKNLGVDSDTIFAIGSASKAFTTMDMAILVERGLLDWDKPVRNYLPNFKLFDPTATEHMTPRDLVCHRSGLPRHDLIWYNSPRSRQQILDSLQYLEPNKDFRSTWQYQNLMFLTAGMLVEKISGMSWEDFTQKEIFDRLGMSRSNASVDKSQESDNFSYPHQEVKGEMSRIPFRNIDMIGPAGSINSCLNDMTKWVRLHLNGSVDGNELVSKAQLKELHSPAMVMPEAFMGLEEFKEISQGNYALGWFVHYYRGHKLIHHGGAIDGFLAMITFMPDDNVGTVVLTNAGGMSAFWAVTFMMYDRLLGLEPLPWHDRWLALTLKGKEAAEKSQEKASTKKVEGTKPSHDLGAYAGEFVHPGYGPFTVKLKDDQLYAYYNNMEFKLDHYHYDIFEANSTEMAGQAGLPVFFYTDYQGAIARMAAPLEPNVKEIVFERVADQSMYEKSFLEQFVGKYEVSGHHAVVSLKGGKVLMIAVPNMPEMELEPCQGTEFKLKGMEVVRIEFIKTDGVVSGLDMSQPGGVMSAKKIE
ncbi:MAG: serine hydrolase, partial [Anaerolineaceae bacterium]